MTYIRTSRAAVPVASTRCCSSSWSQAPLDQVRRGTHQSSTRWPRPAQTLWASRPLQVQAGRLVAVRLRGEVLQVGLATVDGVRWVNPHRVLTEAQATLWARRSRFTPEG